MKKFIDGPALTILTLLLGVLMILWALFAPVAYAQSDCTTKCRTDSGGHLICRTRCRVEGGAL